MSTLTTRIAGFKFVIVQEESGRKTGMFVAENKGKRTTFMDLPFELRSTYSQAQGQTLPILIAAEDAIREWVNKESWHYQSCETMNCDRCFNFAEYLNRRYTTLRGFETKVLVGKNKMRTAVRRRLHMDIATCGLCEGVLLCDEHSMRAALTH